MDINEKVKRAEEEVRGKNIKMYGEVIEDKTLKNLQEQAGDINLFDTLVVEIASPGGSVYEGLRIMIWLDQLSAQGKNVITVVTANAYSIASLIMLAADMRLISTHGKVMVHNPMVPELQYVNANDLENYVASLRELEGIMYEMYQTFTRLDEDTIKTLMDNETYLLPNEAVNYGFADMVIEIKPKPYQMAINQKKHINMSKTLNLLQKVIGMVNKSDFINQVYSKTDGTGDIEIYQNDPSMYKIGDRTNVEEGEVKISDGSVLVIEDWVITDIVKDAAVESVEETEGEPIIPEEEVAPENGFNEGPAPTTEEPKAEETVAPAPVEVPKEDPSKVIETTESTITKKETVAMEEPAPVEAKEKEGFDMIAMEDRLSKMIEEKFDEISNKLTENKESGDKKMVELENKVAETEKIQNIAAEAIDTLAGATVSGFKPDAKAKAKEAQHGSIFQRLKQARGLN